MKHNRFTRLAVGAVALLAIACGDFNNSASIPNAQFSFSLFALTGAPINAPTSISFLGGTTAADASFAFDVALDLDADGNTRVYPVRSIGGALSGDHQRVGLQLVPGTFDALREAPAAGYDTLGFKSLPTGSVMAVEILDRTTCLFSTRGSLIYAKLTVDSLSVANRRIFGRAVIDRNCGYRELVPDSIPSR